MENKNPCSTCMRVKDPRNCENKNCKEWREWFVRKWEELRMLLPQPPKEPVYCKECEHLMFSDCYGECSKAYKGIVNPNDTCEHAKRKPPKQPAEEVK